MNLKGEHISLRTPIKDDVDTIFKWENDPEHWLVSNTVAPYTREEIDAFVENQSDLYENQQMRLMIISSQQEQVGCVDLFDFDPKNKRVGIGILIDHAYRGKGMGREAIDLILEYCFGALELHSVYAEVLKGNRSSEHLFETAGFDRVGEKRDWLWTGDGFVDQYLYQRLNDA